MTLIGPKRSRVEKYLMDELNNTWLQSITDGSVEGRKERNLGESLQGNEEQCFLTWEKQTEETTGKIWDHIRNVNVSLTQSSRGFP